MRKASPLDISFTTLYKVRARLDVMKCFIAEGYIELMTLDISQPILFRVLTL